MELRAGATGAELVKDNKTLKQKVAELARGARRDRLHVQKQQWPTAKAVGKKLHQNTPEPCAAASASSWCTNGGIEDSRNTLPKLLKGVDAVVCPVDCGMG